MNRVAFVSRCATVHKMAAPYGLAPKMATPREDPELLKKNDYSHTQINGGLVITKIFRKTKRGPSRKR